MSKTEDVCRKCESYVKCGNAALENKTIRCVNFGEMIKFAKDTIEKINNTPTGYICTPEELKTMFPLIFQRKDR